MLFSLEKITSEGDSFLLSIGISAEITELCSEIPPVDSQYVLSVNPSKIPKVSFQETPSGTAEKKSERCSRINSRRKLSKDRRRDSVKNLRRGSH